MSKQSRKKARRHKNGRRTFAFVCPNCARVDDCSPAAVLTQIADALNLAADSGLKVVLRRDVVMVHGKSHGSVSGGLVLPLKGGRWTARDQQYDRFVQVPSLLDEDD